MNSGSGAETITFGCDQIGRETSEASTISTSSKYVKYDWMGRVTMLSANATFTQPLASFVYGELGNRIDFI